ncbi:MAG TPA: YidC/Oxa1 family membrane protein insertase [Gemmatimonadaceae bacterium]|nr:YidC/Oxa1 family membrane protein insertase [Gemmatimonadaceae bacterium]
MTLVRIAMFGAAHVCGGSLGAGIAVVSIVVRVALLPLTIRMARHSLAQQARLAAIAPQLESLRKRYEKDPLRLLTETRALQEAHGIRALTPGGFVTLLLQAPLLGAVMTVVRRGLGAGVRFLWIGDLGRPDALLLGLVASVSAAIVATSPSATGRAQVPAAMWLVSGAVTLAFLWSASSALTLSVGAGSLVSLAQNWIVSREKSVRG